PTPGCAGGPRSYLTGFPSRSSLSAWASTKPRREKRARISPKPRGSIIELDMLRLFPSRQRTVAIVGLQGHGKTVFLASLFRDSFFLLSETLRPFAVRAVSAKAERLF